MDALQDNVIFERLNEASDYKDLTVTHLEQFATEGEEFLSMSLFQGLTFNFLFGLTLVCVCLHVQGCEHFASRMWTSRRGRIRNGWRSTIVSALC